MKLQLWFDIVDTEEQARAIVAREKSARLLWAVRHALEDARQWGDIVSEIVSINGRTLDNDEFHYCARMARQEA